MYSTINTNQKNFNGKMRKLETFKRNLVRQRTEREYANHQRVIAMSDDKYPDIILGLPSKHVGQYYAVGFQKFFMENLAGRANFTKAQVEAMIEQHLCEAHRDYIAKQLYIVNNDTRWVPKLVIIDGHSYQIKLGAVVILSFSY